MIIEAKRGRITEPSCEAVLIGHFEGEPFPAHLKGLEPALAAQFKDALRSGEFTGKLQQVVCLRAKARSGVKRLLVVGLGKKEDRTLDRIRRAAGRAAQQLREMGLNRCGGMLLAKPADGASALQIAQAMVEGIILGSYRFQVYKTQSHPPESSVEAFVFLEEDPRRLEQVRKGVRTGRIVAEAATFARDLGNYPSNYATPSRLAETAQEMAGEVGLECEVMEKPQIEALGMGGLLGVARGSQEPPKFIILKYRGAETRRRPVALVGKTITFDSGGISLKPSERMEQMKYDMMGGAAVMATLKAVAQLGPSLNVLGFLPATENMPSGTAIKPGDVIKMFSGKTVEVINTDAEGRLILADALAYAARYSPSAILDVATLTGACTVALGQHAAGLLGNHRGLLETVKEAGEATGERVWELPLWEEYREQIKSDIADLKNVGSRGGGTITAAAFLGEFVGTMPWAHLDIASTAWADENRPYTPKGPTGIGVRLLTHLLTDARAAKSLGRVSIRRRSGKERG